MMLSKENYPLFYKRGTESAAQMKGFRTATAARQQKHLRLYLGLKMPCVRNLLRGPLNPGTLGNLSPYCYFT
jgi:hypothetical protein